MNYDNDDEPLLDFATCHGAPGLPMDFSGTLTLEAVTPDTLNAEFTAKVNREKLRKMAERQLTGTAGDMTPTIPGMGIAGEVPLLSREWVAA